MAGGINGTRKTVNAAVRLNGPRAGTYSPPPLARGSFLDVNSDEIAAFGRDGFLSPLDGISPDEAAAAGREVARFGDGAEALRLTHLWFGWAYDLVLTPRLLDRAEGLLGPDIVVWGSIILRKPPGHPGHVPWHQDAAYPGRAAAPSLSAWVALTDSAADNGCMQVLPGSHRVLLPHTLSPEPGNMLRGGFRIAEPIDDHGAVDLVLAAGEASLHDGQVIHGSAPNRSGRPRIGFVIRYTTPAMADPGFTVVLARGRLPAGCGLSCAGRPVETADTFADYLKANAARAAAVR
jgi:non-heme Fe2+,alpha-ketoglutarate-dependent halogenase